MRNLLNPKWILVLNTLPIVILLLLYNGQFTIIKSLLNEESIELWKSFGWALVSLGSVNFFYTVYLIVKRQKVSVAYALVALVSYISYIYFYSFHLNDLIPFTIPQWMMSDEMLIYVGTFLMPTLAYSLFVLVSHFTTQIKEHKAWKNFIAAFIIPVFWYVFFLIILPLWQPVSNDFSIHVLLILIIIGTLLFLFFLIRALYIIGTKNSGFWIKNHLYWKIPITIVLPLLGLAINNDLLMKDLTFGSFIFGDLSNPWFYIIAIINGLLICLPNLDNKKYRLLLFAGRSVTLSFSLYFFLVFLPFLPFSVMAIIALGVGFLMLTPLLVFVIHISTLTKDIAYLKTEYPAGLVKTISIAGLLLIPLFITGKFLNERIVLFESLEYVFTPDYSKYYRLDKKALQNIFETVRSNKDRSNSGLFGSQTPYLSTFYNWLVLDNLSLSEAKIYQLETIFFNKHMPRNPRTVPFQNEAVCITDVNSVSNYDSTQNAWISWIDLELTNSKQSWNQEFETIIDLPTGSWISDYFLYVGERKEMGILAEKKAAMWIYSQIRNENRDPGLLHYLTGNKVMFKVFPFAADEVRKTGIELIHKEPITISIDGNIIELGNEKQTLYSTVETENAIYISSKQKQELKQIERKPYYHFMVDVSENSNDNITAISDKIEKLIQSNPTLSENAKISFVNTYVTTNDLNKDWKQQLESQNFEGGFYLERAIRKTLVNSFEENTKRYPVIVVVTNGFYNSILSKDFSDLKMTYPESDLFYLATNKGKLEVHSLQENPTDSLFLNTKISFNSSVLEFKDKDNKVHYLPNDNKPTIIFKNEEITISENNIKNKEWESGLLLHGMWTSQNIYPETANKEWLNLVRYSFASKIMTPVTSYLVVENKAQKEMLKKKQEQVLSGNKSLDIETTEQRMSEPNTIILLVLFGLVILFLENRKRRMNKKNTYL